MRAVLTGDLLCGCGQCLESSLRLSNPGCQLEHEHVALPCSLSFPPKQKAGFQDHPKISGGQYIAFNDIVFKLYVTLIVVDLEGHYHRPYLLIGRETSMLAFIRRNIRDEAKFSAVLLPVKIC